MRSAFRRRFRRVSDPFQRGNRPTLRRLKETGLIGLDPAEAVAGRKAIEDTIGLEEHYAVGEETVERQDRPHG